MTGDHVSPSNIPLGDLAELLVATERAIISCATAEGTRTSDEPEVSLAGVRPASSALALSVQEPLLPVVVRILEALAERRESELPPATYRALRSISGLVEKRGWGVELKADPAIEAPTAAIGPGGSRIPEPSAPRYLEGTATLVGRCLRVGGAVTPRAEIRPKGGGRLVNIALSEREAKVLAQRLYEEVTLQGRARWQVDSWELVGFRVTHISDFRRTDPVLAMQALALAGGGDWDGSEVHGGERVGEIGA